MYAAKKNDGYFVPEGLLGVIIAITDGIILVIIRNGHDNKKETRNLRRETYEAANRCNIEHCVFISTWIPMNTEKRWKIWLLWSICTPVMK